MSKLTMSQVLQNAIAEKGYRESPPGSNNTKYGTWYGMNREPWCAMFVSWCFRNDLTLILGKFARTDTKAKALATKGLLHKGTYGLRKGDVIFFNFGSYPTRYLGIHHVGLCLGRLNDGRYVCIEGNTEGMVAVRYRAASSIAAYFRPKYYSPPRPAPKPVPKPVSRPTVKPGAQGTAVKSIQALLNKHGYRLIVDGHFGPKTVAAVKDFQKKHKVKVDGIVGATTWQHLLQIPKPTPTVVPTGVVRTTIARRGLNVRAAPGTSSRVLAVLKYGTKVRVVGTTGAWYKIKYGNGYGYIAKKFVK